MQAEPRPTTDAENADSAMEAAGHSGKLQTLHGTEQEISAAVDFEKAERPRGPPARNHMNAAIAAAQRSGSTESTPSHEVTQQPGSEQEPAMPRAQAATGYFQEVARQTLAMLWKNLILAQRNRVATFLRVFVSLFFLLVTFFVTKGLERRYAQFPYFQDLPKPKPSPVGGVPRCTPSLATGECFVFTYTPASTDEYVPGTDFKSLETFATSVSDHEASCNTPERGARPVCDEEDCKAGLIRCAKCCELFRVHCVVRRIMQRNGSGAFPIPPEQVLGFEDGNSMDKYMFDHQDSIQGAYLFSSPSDTATTFVVQQNSTPHLVRTLWQDPMTQKTIPMQVAASHAIAEALVLNGTEFNLNVNLMEFAHPQSDTASFERETAPLFLLACAMFPFVIQMAETTLERELKLRQALFAMGLHDLAFWLSWHLYESLMAMLTALFLCAFGCMFQFKTFLDNDFGVVFLSFWLFGQALTGFAFFVGAFLRRSGQAVTVGLVGFLLGFLLFFTVALFAFPFGLHGTMSFSYELSVDESTWLYKSNGDELIAPAFALVPFSLLVRIISDLGALTVSNDRTGLTMATAYSYCKLEDECDPAWSVGKCWERFVCQYVGYSLLALYADNVLPDALGVRKPTWYFLSPAYWWFGAARVQDGERELIEESTDEDVVAEEERVLAHAGGVMDQDNAVEIRGLVQQFSRGGKPLYAVKAPWYGVGKRQLFALLGPNGAGKTTTINMLTGFLPPSRGNALVMGHTVAHPNGITQVRKLIGLCPQFDTLWGSLTAMEHLELFGTIKGLQKDSLRVAAARGLEQVKLDDVANVTAATFSGGMRRRLSVAIALIGNPQVLFLDEPTTGMDPISRRHVWDVIEAAKQDRCVILTTHSMEEADILGDKIAIMAKGRLRCIGTSVRLKMKFGAGYKVSIQLKGGAKSDARDEVVALLRDRGGASLTDESRGYLHFAAATGSEERMSEVFAELEGRGEELHVENIHLSMSSLEDVFLRIAKDSEVEAARREQVTTKVTLRSGEEAKVLLGDEEEQEAASGFRFRVQWGTDENGNLVPVDTIEELASQAALTSAESSMREVPAGREERRRSAGNTAAVNAGAAREDGAAGGENAGAGVEEVEGPSAATHREGPGGEKEGAASTGGGRSREEWTREEVRERVEELDTPFLRRTEALMRKNLAFQATRRVTNCCLVLVPIIILGLLLALQYLIESSILTKPRVRCPYCGPNDEFGMFYCAGSTDCVDYFFPAQKRDEYVKQFGTDVIAECRKVSEECGGNGNISCFKPEWSQSRQRNWCPYTSGFQKPIFSYATPPMHRSKTPVIYTSDDPATAERLVDNLFRTGSAEARQTLRGVQSTVVDALFAVLGGVPFLGCADERTQRSLLSQAEEEAVCAVLTSGIQTGGVCCIDLSAGENPTADGSSGPLIFGRNYWSPTPEVHNDANYSALVATCAGAGRPPSECHLGVVATWGRDGVRFATGTGKESLANAIGKVGGGGLEVSEQSALLGGLLEAVVESGAEQFRCVEARLEESVQEALSEAWGGGECVQIEEGLAILAQRMAFNHSVHPRPEPFREVPQCTQRGNCQVWEGQWARECRAATRAVEEALEGGQAGAALLLELEAIPCACRWSLLARLWVSTAVFPVQPLAQSTPDLPRHPSCAARPGGGSPPQCALDGALHPFALSALQFATPAYHTRSFLLDERALSVDEGLLWNRRAPSMEHYEAVRSGDNASVGPQDPPPFEPRDWSWVQAARARGNLSLVAKNCAEAAEEVCWLRKVANLTGVDFDCLGAAATRADSTESLFSRIYGGFWDRYSDEENQQQEEFLLGLDFHDSVAGPGGRLNVSVMYNNTTPFSFRPPDLLRLAAPVRAAIDAFVSAAAGASRDATAAMVGMKEMPKGATMLNLDLGGTVGPFFFSLAFSLLFPTIVVSLVYEKETRLRVMMEMMGLGRTAYWVINYVFWFGIYSAFTFVFVGAAYLLRLPSGYRIGLLTRQSFSIHVVFLFLFINQTIAFAFLWASVLSSSRNAQIAATLWVMAMTLIAWTTWDSGNYLNDMEVPESAKTLITLFPIWSMYRGLLDYAEYAYQAARTGSPGLQWEDLSEDPRVGLDTTMLCLAVEWAVFLAAALYLDQVLPTGHGIPAHPLFCFGVRSSFERGSDEEADAGAEVPEDVRAEELRAEELAERRDAKALPAVLIEKIRKEYPGASRGESKVAVQTLTMGVEHGECFGLLGPNGAGKTTLINMLVGFMQPTRGGARVEGFDVRTDMAKIYTIMGVCPQHDVLWESLTARQHMAFYGRLKNLRGAGLEEAISAGLRGVSLEHVIDERVQTFSGGMKRRLSVAIALIGRPLCCYLDEPSTGLDPASRRTLWRAVTKAKRTSGLLLTTHSMEEAEGLCDRIGIFVSGRLRCVGEPKALAARFGGAYTLTVTSAADPAAVAAMVHSFAPNARLTYSLAGTQKFELLTAEATLSTIFGTLAKQAPLLRIRDWGIANTTLEEAFIKIAKDSRSLL